MNKFKVICDEAARPFCSTKIIVAETNAAAKALGFYSEDGDIVMYDTLGQTHGSNPKAFWCAFELPFPIFILNQMWPKPIFGLSKDNATLASYAGYPNRLLNYASLGVNRTHWPLVNKKRNLDKFVFIAMDESSSRSGLDILIPAFGEQFKGQKGVVLYLKDREATPIFKTWVAEQATKYDVSIIHDDRHMESYQEQVELFEGADAAVCVNRSHSFGMTVLQGMSCGLPTICTQYNGFVDYTSALTVCSVRFQKILVSQPLIDYLVAIGLKNHLFPPTNQYYSTLPFWSEVDKEDLKQQMQRMVDDSAMRVALRKMSDMTASWFSWERTAVNMSYVLSKYE